VHELSARLAVVQKTELTQSGDCPGGEVEPGDGWSAWASDPP
jgi:hypothetical protein